MPFEIRFSPAALDDLDGILGYIAGELMNSTATAKTVLAVCGRIEHLASHPFMERELPETVKTGFPCRHLASGDYRVFYHVEGSKISIVRILHAKRNHMAVLFPDG